MTKKVEEEGKYVKATARKSRQKKGEPKGNFLTDIKDKRWRWHNKIMTSVEARYLKFAGETITVD